MNRRKISKIGILTHKGNWNYGGLLQALALHHWLEAKGFEVEMINLNQIAFTRGTISKIRNLLLDPIFAIRKLFSGKHLKVRKQKHTNADLLRKFQDFKTKNQLRYSEGTDEKNIGKLVTKYDAIIVGSDQVWAFKCFRPLLFLMDWQPEYSGIKISYAACSPDAYTPWFYKKFIKRKLLQFDALSVRDEMTQAWVKKCSGLQPDIVADPTLLYDFDYLLDKNEYVAPYIFVYCLGGEIEGGGAAVFQEIKKYYGDLKIVAVTIPHVSLEAEKFADEVIYDASPQKWLTLLANAAFVYTDSFHGCIFALKYRKQFLAYYAQLDRASRLLDLKKRYGISSVIVASVNDMLCERSIELGIDYKKVQPIVENQKKIAVQFLENALCFGKE